MFEIRRQDFLQEWVKYLHLKLSTSHLLAISSKLMIVYSTRKLLRGVLASLFLPPEASIKFSKTLPGGTKKFFV